MSRKIKYNISVDDDSFYLVGISSDFFDYQLSWKLNTGCGLNLQFGRTIEKKRADNEIVVFTSYYCEDGEKFFRLISNRSDFGYLLPKLKNIDFFLYIQGISEEEFRLFVNQSRQIDGIFACIAINVETLNARQKSTLL